MAQTKPWISFHAPWVERARSGMVILQRLEKFLAACAVDPAPDTGELSVYEELGETIERGIRAASWNAKTLPAALEAHGYRPGPVVAEVADAIGTGHHTMEGTGAGTYRVRWQWTFRPPFDPAPLIAIYKRHEADPPVSFAPHKRGVGLLLTHWFEVKRPGETGPLFPGAELRSGVLIWAEARRANLSLRYDSPEMTPALRQAHTEIVAELGPKTPRHALQRIIPATAPGRRERREPIS